MPVSKAKQASNKKHDKANFKYQSVKLKISEYEKLKQAVEISNEPTNSFLRSAIMNKVHEYVPEKDGESLNGFVNRAIDETMQRDNKEGGENA